MPHKTAKKDPDIHDQYKDIMIALCGISENDFPIRSYDIRRLIIDLSPQQIVHRCAELEDKGYLKTDGIQSSISKTTPSTITVRRITSHGREYVSIVSNPKRWSKARKWFFKNGLPTGELLVKISKEFFQ